MLLTLSTTHLPAHDLGYLLAKNPARAQSFELAFGRALVFYPEVSEEKCTAALLLEIDPVGLVRGRRGPAGNDRALEQYVNDRPYVASSFLSVAIAQVLGSALSGKSRERAELAATAIPLVARVSALPCRGGEDLLRRLFEPLGYSVAATSHPLDESLYPGEASRLFTVELAATTLLTDLLSHLYVLLPVLDNDKHYWVGDDEVEKLLRHGEGWLSSHPDRELIATRYLKHRRLLIDSAMDRLRDEDVTGEAVEAPRDDAREEKVERTLSLHEQRHGTVLSTLRAHGVRSVIDLGCGEGRLVRELLKEAAFEKVVGVDVSHRALEIAASRLKVDRMPPMVRQRLTLIHGSLMYRDERLNGFDGAAVVEVIEHMDVPRLRAFERVVFEFARPRVVVVTTPNREYNVKWETLEAGQFRHKDHRFEWTRAEFRDWAERVAGRFGYRVEMRAVGPEDEAVGGRRRWGCLCGEHHRPRTLPRRHDRRLRLRQVVTRAQALQAHRDPLLRHLPRLGL